MGRGKKRLRLERPNGIKNNNPTTAGSFSAPPPPWIELSQDVKENILSRLGPDEILETAQNVCTTWHSVCNQPSFWRVIDMEKSGDDVRYFGNNDLLHYISQRF
ncbi:hypothetical protein CASFOL_014541 [Castilleja foliolosa]|uniref:F-box domain-containing protein n=1 Tax=Castilleja foliolosa TaxID=1961234 RepID=A0ABD3DPX0_9LAMI